MTARCLSCPSPRASLAIHGPASSNSVSVCQLHASSSGAVSNLGVQDLFQLHHVCMLFRVNIVVGKVNGQLINIKSIVQLVPSKLPHTAPSLGLSLLLTSSTGTGRRMPTNHSIAPVGNHPPTARHSNVTHLWLSNRNVRLCRRFPYRSHVDMRRVGEAIYWYDYTVACTSQPDNCI